MSELTPGIARSTFSPQRDYPSIVAFGRFDRAHNYVKQSAVVAEAFVRLSKAVGGDPARAGTRFWRDARLTLIGVEDNHASEITKYVSQQAGMAANVHVVPFIDDPDDIEDIFVSRGANIGVVPSLRESFGLVALEFIGHGIPLILSERTGVYQWLYELYAGEALGCLANFSPVGSPDPQASNPTDVGALFELIQKTAVELEHKIRNANLLRRRLAVHSWDETALQFGTVVGLRRRGTSGAIEHGVTQLAMLQAQFAAKVSTRIASSRVKEIISNLDRFVSTGRYKSAEAELAQLKKLEPRSISAREVKLYEIELETRLGSYHKALKSIEERSRLRSEMKKADAWDITDLRMESLRNIALRDMGRYHDAVDHSKLLVEWHEKWASQTEEPAERQTRNLHLASALRKKARCLAYVGDEEEAQQALQRARIISGDQPSSNERGKWHFGRGEILRHNRKYQESLAEYTSAIEVAQELPDLDLYAWACLCLSDAFFMLGRSDEARDTLALAKSAIELFGEELPVEMTHIQLSELTLGLTEEPNDVVAGALDGLVLLYQARGVEWVDSYLGAMSRTRRPPFPKRF